MGADDQQERLDGYISGYVDGEGCFAVAVNRNPTCRTGFQLVPEFHVSQNGDRSQVLELIHQRFGGAGYIKSNGRKDRALVYVVRRRQHLLKHVIPFFEFPAEIRRVMYTTNAVESLHMSLRKIIKTRGSFPSEEAALKLLYLALRNVIVKWDALQHWKQALNHFQMLWGERIQAALNR